MSTGTGARRARYCRIAGGTHLDRRRARFPFLRLKRPFTFLIRHPVTKHIADMVNDDRALFGIVGIRPQWAHTLLDVERQRCRRPCENHGLHGGHVEALTEELRVA